MRMKETEIADNSYIVIHEGDDKRIVVKRGIVFENFGDSGRLHMIDVNDIDALRATTCLTKFLLSRGLADELLKMLNNELK